MLSQLTSKTSIAIILTILCLLCVGTFLGAEDGVVTTVTLQEPKLTESSGLAFSHRDPDCVWTHNDSGDSARLFCFNHKTGEQTGSCVLKDAKAIDWEALSLIAPRSPDAAPTASTDAKTAAQPELIVADCGDNHGRRSNVTLYRFAEPDPHADTKLSSKEWSAIAVTLEGGAVNCEAIWCEPATNQVILLAKTVTPFAGVYGVSLDPLDAVRSPATTGQEEPQTVVAKRLATLPVPAATGADRDQASGEIIVVNYWQTFRFPQQPGDDLLTQISRTPKSTKLPKWRQVEAVAWDRASQPWITTEGVPAQLGKLRN
ncbi:hypothetical protein SAMN06265222_10447 [Neorhodopirellula lusitana]|uniref:Secreted protein n=1 Tax=Neorhodopirellula lusitana TaxID=445327 RepID=A0ABY1PYM5_9BACT|nr:hypothetical protein [Neorhodopirellula lusitana]SMP53055.1 hypothetical protein SAMN06265222_10447 [Neorhodopirellula lusitana]